MKTILTLDDYFALHGSPESQTLLDNATDLLHRLNQYLALAQADGVFPEIDPVSRNWVASGYRPPGVNAATRNAAAASKHLTCDAADLRDSRDRCLMRWVLAHLKDAEWIGLWFEDPRWTWRAPDGLPWVHMQRKSPASGNRVYIPSSDPPTAPALEI